MYHSSWIFYQNSNCHFQNIEKGQPSFAYNSIGGNLYAIEFRYNYKPELLKYSNTRQILKSRRYAAMSTIINKRLHIYSGEKRNTSQILSNGSELKTCRLELSTMMLFS
jgi:hypothetical protein